jgi:hypothetical protein
MFDIGQSTLAMEVVLGTVEHRMCAPNCFASHLAYHGNYQVEDQAVEVASCRVHAVVLDRALAVEEAVGEPSYEVVALAETVLAGAEEHTVLLQLRRTHVAVLADTLVGRVLPVSWDGMKGSSCWELLLRDHQ